MIIIAHNIERIESTDGLDDLIGALVELTKKKLEWVYDEEEKKSSQARHPRRKRPLLLRGYDLAPVTRTHVRAPVIFMFTFM